MTNELSKLERLVNLLTIKTDNCSEAHISQISDALNPIPFFKKLIKTVTNRIVLKNLQIISVTAGEYVFRYGDNPNSFYVVISGYLDVMIPKYDKAGNNYTINDATEQDFKRVSTINEGQSFGELALLANRPRAASVIAKTDVILIVCDRKTYVDHVKEIEKYKMDKKLDFLRNNIWPDVDDTLAMKLSYYFKEIVIEKNKRLFSENTTFNHLYVVVKGRISVI